jgi:hypothetical protein
MSWQGASELEPSSTKRCKRPGHYARHHPTQTSSGCHAQVRLREETARQRQALLSEHSLARFDEDNRTAVRAGLQAQVEQADAVVGASIQSAVAHAAQVRMLCGRRLALN